jgi:hypothetical protein
MFITIGEFFILYPALAFLLLRRGAPLPSPSDTPRLGHWAAAARRHARAVRVVVLAVAALGALAASRVALDPTLHRLRPAASPRCACRRSSSCALHALGAGRAVLVGGRDTESALVAGEQVAARLRGYRDDGLIDGLRPSTRWRRRRRCNAPGWRNTTPCRARRRWRASTASCAPRASAGALHGVRHQLRRAAHRDRDGRLAGAGALRFGGRTARARAPGGTMVAAYVDPTDGGSWPAIAARLHADLPELSVAVAARALLEDTLRRVLRHEVILFIGLAVLVNLLLLWLTLGNLRDRVAVLVPVLFVVVTVPRSWPPRAWRSTPSTSSSRRCCSASASTMAPTSPPRRASTATSARRCASAAAPSA